MPSRELGLLKIFTIIFANIASRTEGNGDCQLLGSIYSSHRRKLVTQLVKY